MTVLAFIVACICFALATFGVSVADHGLVAPGLFFFALGHLPLGKIG